MCGEVAMLRIYPSIMASTVRHFLQLPVRGVVLQVILALIGQYS